MRNIDKGIVKPARRIGLATVVLGVLAFAAAPSSATFPGSNGRIIFTAVVEKTESNEIFSATANGNDVQKLTDSGKKGNAVVGDWSPDGQRIAFDSNRVDIDGRKDVIQIYLMNADGSGETQLTRGPGFHGTPGWSPDGERLAIDTDWGLGRPQSGIWIVPVSDPDGVTQADAARVTAVPDGHRYDGEPQFSPDGSTIVFTRFRTDHESAIHTVNPDGSGLERHTSWGLNASDPDWSPDGERITFDSGDSGRPGSKGDIWVMRADGSDRERLTDIRRVRRGEGFNLANNPVWSPSGSKIMFTRFKPNNTVLKVMRADGSRQRSVLEQPPSANKVDWGTHP